MRKLLITLSCAVFALAACDSPQEKAEDRLEDRAEANAAAAGNAVAALGLTERQLLDADLVDAQGRELGDVAAVQRGPDGKVDGLLVEIEDSNPDRFVRLPLDGLAPLKRGNDTDLASKLTAGDLAKLPETPLPAG